MFSLGQQPYGEMRGVEVSVPAYNNFIICKFLEPVVKWELSV
jgi:hypothetical protein